MADDLAKMFGVQEYDPSINSGQPVGMDNAENPVGAGNDLASMFGSNPYQEPNAPEPAAMPSAKEEPSLSDWGYSWMRGSASVGTMLGGFGEYIGRQLGTDTGTQFFKGLRDAAQNAEQYWFDKMSPAGKRDAEKAWATTGPDAAWKDLDSIMFGVLGSAPATIVTMGPSGMAARAAYATTLAKTAGSVAAKKAAALEAAGLAMARTGAVTEGTMSAGGVASDITNAIEQMTPEQLHELDGYKEFKAKHPDMSEEDIRQGVIANATRWEAAVSGLNTAAIDLLTGPLEGKLFVPGAGVGRRLAQGAGIEAAQEAGQNPVETIMTNLGTEQPWSKGAGEAAVSGAVIGALSGGPVAAAAGGETNAGVAKKPPGGPLSDLTADELKAQVDQSRAIRDTEVTQARETAKQNAASMGADALEQEIAGAEAAAKISQKHKPELDTLNRLWNQRLAADEEARYFEEQKKEDQKRAEIQAAAAKRYEEGLAQREQDRQAAAATEAVAKTVATSKAEVEQTAVAETRRQAEEAKAIAEKQRRAEKADMQLRKLQRMRQEKGLAPKTEEGLPAISPYPSPAEVEAFKGKKPKNAAMAEAFSRAANEAATSPSNALAEPTEPQKEKGNYKKGHPRFQGLPVTIENPAGSTRSKTNPVTGQAWTQDMKDHYGYIKGTTSAEGPTEKLDVFVGDDHEATHAFVVDQVNQDTGEFDEHKVMLGYPNQLAAIRAYKRNFPKGWKMGKITAMPMNEFKQWTKTGDMTRPLQKIARPSPNVPVASEAQFEEVIQAKTRKEGRRPRVLFRRPGVEEITAAPPPAAAPESFKPQKFSLAELKNVPGDTQRKSMAEMKDFTRKVESGEIKPNVIVQTRNGKPVRIVEGNHTLRALRLLGHKDVTVRTQEIGDGNVRMRLPEPAGPPRTTADLARAVWKENGFTAHPETGAPIKEGYAVGIGAEEKVRGFGGEAFIEGYRRRHAEELAQPDHAFGGWVHKGETYLDVSRIFPETPEGLAAATALAKKNGEIGIMQLSKSPEEGYIPMEYTAEEMAATRPGDTVQAVHYSHQAALNVLEGSRYGTGIKGEEASRLALPSGESVRDRVYFYAGKHARERGLGRHAYTWNQENVYNLDKDPMDFFGQIPADIKGSDEQANYLDNLVKDAGYSGVYSPSHGGIGYLFGDVVSPEYKGTVTDTLFRRESDEPTDVTEADARTVAEQLQSSLPLLDVKVTPSPMDLPDDIYQEVARLNGFGAKGLYHIPTGTIYIFSDNATSVQDVARTILHEGVGHKGLRYLLGPDLPALLDDIYANGNQASIGSIMKRYQLDPVMKADQRTAAEEYIAHMAERNVDANIFQKVVDAVRRVLRDLGLVHSWSDADIRALLRDTRASLRETRSLSKIKIPSDLRVLANGDVEEVMQNADIALRQMEKRISVLEQLKTCVG